MWIKRWNKTEAESCAMVTGEIRCALFNGPKCQLQKSAFASLLCFVCVNSQTMSYTVEMEAQSQNPDRMAQSWLVIIRSESCLAHPQSGNMKTIALQHIQSQEK